MASNTFFPKISDILKIKLPSGGDELDINLQSIIGDVYYRNLNFSQDPDGGSGFYSCVLILPYHLNFNIPGLSDFEISINGGDTSMGIEIPIRLQYKFPIVGILNSLPKINSLDVGVEFVFNLMLKIANKEDFDLLKNCILTFHNSDTSIQDFIEKFIRPLA